MLEVRIGELLLERELISKRDLREALTFQSETGALLGQALLRLGALSEQDLLDTLSSILGLEVCTKDDLPERIQDFVELAERYRLSLNWLASKEALIWEKRTDSKEVLCLAARNPIDGPLRERLELSYSGEIKLFLIQNRLLDNTLAAIAGQNKQIEPGDDENSERLREMAEEAPVIDFVNTLFEDALRADASDIHIEPGEHQFSTRLRIDGVLGEPNSYAKGRFEAVASRIKLISAMDIAERRLPQDGRQAVRFAGEDVDLRVSTLPGSFGESIVLRLLRKKKEIPSFDELGIIAKNKTSYLQCLSEPNGVVLVTGPTGSGKSTTLYRSLSHLNNGDRKLITIEDPIEYEMNGVTQVQAKPDIGYTFARGLRAILRQDPDIIMVGEIRDSETAQICIQSAMTGHLVLSTLHTNSALGAIERLSNLGVDRFLISAALRGVVGQRLLRRLCAFCSEPVSGSVLNKVRAQLNAINSGGDQLENGDWREPVGCSRCRYTGYSGRVAAIEVLFLNDALRSAMHDVENYRQIEKLAIEGGYRDMLVDGLEKASNGITSLSEVMRVLAGMSNMEAGYEEI